MERKIKYGAFTTIAQTIRQFMLPALLYLDEHGYDITIGSKYHDVEVANFPKHLKYKELDLDRGFHLWKTIKNIFVLYNFFKKEKFDMIEYGTENVSMCASIAGWAAGVPVRIYNHWGARYVGYTGFPRMISFIIERICSIFSTDILQQTQKNLEMCIADGIYPRSKVRVLGYGGTMGADFKKFDRSRKEEWGSAFRNKYGIPEDDLVFGDVGFVRKDKGSNELIEAFRNLNNRHCWLVFVGETYDIDAPDKDLLDWAKASDRVIFTGKVMDVEHYLAAYDILVHPSYREGLGMVLQEAGAFGIPNITTNIPGPSEFGYDRKTGLIVEVKNAKDLEDKMRYLLEHRELIPQMSKEVYKLTEERYERSKMIKRVYDHREELLKKYRIK